jgi:hypothetical protein
MHDQDTMKVDERSESSSALEDRSSATPEAPPKIPIDPDDYGPFVPGVDIEHDFQRDVLQLMKDRQIEVYEYQVEQLDKHIDWTFAISAGVVTAFILKNSDHRLALSLIDRLFVFALLVSGTAGLFAKFWRLDPQASQPLNTSTKDQLRKLRSLREKDHPYAEIEVWHRISLFFDVGLAFALRNHTPQPVKPHKGKTVLRRYQNRIKKKRLIFIWGQFVPLFLALGGYVIFLVFR